MKNWYLIFVIAIVLAAFILGRCSVDPIAVNSERIDTVKVIRDTTIYEVVTMPRLILDTFYINDTVLIDTHEAVNDYYVHRFYSDTMVNDSNATILMKAAVFRNELITSSIQYRINRPTTVVNHVTECKPYKWYIGGSINGNSTKVDLFFTADYQKNGLMYGVGYSPFSKSVQFSFKSHL